MANYIKHTTNLLMIFTLEVPHRNCERMRQHRQHSKLNYHFNFPIYKAFREHGIEHFYIELVEKCPCNDRDELRKTEGKYIRTLSPSLNMRIAGRLKNEYYEDNRDTLIQKVKEYAERNREKVLQNKRDYYQRTRDYRKEYNIKYNEEHKEEIKKYKQQ